MISATCGLVDAVCFLALGGVFAEMMTGNLLLMALTIGTGSALGQSARYILAIMAFSLGALIGGRLLRAPRKLQERRIGFAVEWVIIVAATAPTWVAAPGAHNPAGHVVVAMLALAMGIQNAMVRVHGVPDLATNVMTVTFTGIIADYAGWRHQPQLAAPGDLGRIVYERRPRRPAAAVCHGVALVLNSVVFGLAIIPLMFGARPGEVQLEAPVEWFEAREPVSRDFPPCPSASAWYAASPSAVGIRSCPVHRPDRVPESGPGSPVSRPPPVCRSDAFVRHDHAVERVTVQSTSPCAGTEASGPDWMWKQIRRRR